MQTSDDKNLPGSAQGNQRLSVARLKQFEALQYGMFISFDIQAFLDFDANTPDQAKRPPQSYAPDRLDVDQWISVARDAGMKYAVLTTKRHPGFCLWPSRHTDYSVANSGNRTDVVEQFLQACERRGLTPGLYYPSIDFHHHWLPRPAADLFHVVSSVYQTFQTAQITELLTQYGPIAQMWIDIPNALGRGYRTFLYDHIAKLQPEVAIMMNRGIRPEDYENPDHYWPTDLQSFEQRMPAGEKYDPWQIVEGQRYYLPGEYCESSMTTWYWRKNGQMRPDAELSALVQGCREKRINLLLDAPPDNHGLIPPETVAALMRLKRNQNI